MTHKHAKANERKRNTSSPRVNPAEEEQATCMQSETSPQNNIRQKQPLLLCKGHLATRTHIHWIELTRAYNATCISDGQAQASHAQGDMQVENRATNGYKRTSSCAQEGGSQFEGATGRRHASSMCTCWPSPKDSNHAAHRLGSNTLPPPICNAQC